MLEREELFKQLWQDVLEVCIDSAKMSNKDLNEMMDHYEQLYGLLDKIFSDLRQILPTEQELVDAEDAIALAQNIWTEQLKILCTPKAHALFNEHALEQHKRLGGLGDKTEDFVEHGHQLGLRDERRTWNIRNFEQSQRSQIRHKRRRAQPVIQETIRHVHSQRKRKLKCLAKGEILIKEENKKIKSEQKQEGCMQNLDNCRLNFDISSAQI